MFEVNDFEASDLDQPFTNDLTWGETLDYAVKMVLLLASYERVFNSSRYIREILSVSDEDYTAFTQFRHWDDYHCNVAFQDYGDLLSEHAGKQLSWRLGASKVYEKASGKGVKTLKLIGYLDMDRLEQVQVPFEEILDLIK